MADRTLYVYRLEVTIPEESKAAGWRPAGYYDDLNLSGPLQEDDGSLFRWPMRRFYLSGGSANNRASLLRKWGATVEIVRSKPVEW